MLRRKKLGEVFFDVAKYSLTAGVVGSLLSGHSNVSILLGVGIITLLSLVIGWFILPKEEK